MKLKLFALRLLAAAMASYRQGPARPELDRRQLRQARVAIVKLDGIGDFIQATSFLRTFRRELPQADVTVFCRQPVAEFVRQQFPGWSVVAVPWQRAVREILLDGAIRRRLKAGPPFDLLLDLRAYRGFCETTMASWIPARQKIAFRNPDLPAIRWLRLPKDERIYDHLLELPTVAAPGIPQDLQNHRTLATWLFPQTPGAGQSLPQLTMDRAAREQVAALLETRFQLPREKPFLLVCPGTSTPRKEYPVAALAEAIRQVMLTHPMPVVIAGSPADERTTKPLSQLLSQQGPVVDVSGVFGLAQHLGLISLSRVVLSMDTCHAHFAGAMGTPAVVILGGGHHGFFAPWGESQTFRWLTNRLPCYGCNWECIHDRLLCIEDISPGVIAKNVVEVLNLSARV